MQETSLLKILTICDIKEEVEGVKTFYFSENDIPYQAGQYLTFVHNEKGEEIRRSYSITSSPVLHEPLAVGVKRIDNGIFSRILIDDAQTGDKLFTIGASGFFILPENISQYQQLFFFAAGSGITPIYSLIKTVLHGYPHLSIVLIYSNKSPQQTIFYHALQQLREQFAERFSIEYIFSQSPDLIKAHLHADLLRLFLQQYAITSADKTLYYICGPTNYMRLCTYTLQQKGILSQNIKKENFNIDKIKIKAAPPDREMRQVTIYFGGGKHPIEVQYPDTILTAAKKQNILLPYSCEAGRCGTCAVRCLQGEVWMSYNEVLTEKELENGIVLTCVGYPVNGNVIIKV